MMLCLVFLGKYLHIHYFQFAVTLNMSLISDCEQNMAMGKKKHMAGCISTIASSCRHDPGVMTHTDEDEDEDLPPYNEL